MINRFSKGDKKVVKKLNSLIEGKNKQDRVKNNQALSSPYSQNKNIYFGEIESVSTDTFTGTFYNSEGTKVGSSSPFYQITVNGSGEVGDTFVAIKFNGEWYNLTGGGSGGLHNAFVNGTVSNGTTQSCFLDTDTTGTSITVYFEICGGSSLNSALPRLSDGKRITVFYDGTYWRCTTVFQASEDCT